MSTSLLLTVIQVVLAVLLTGAILLQAQGSGLGTTWSGGGETFHTRRGLEKVIFHATIVMVGLFALVSLLSVLWA